MAITQNTYTGNGSTVLYSFTFPYLDAADIKVSIDGSLTSAYSLANATTIEFDAAPANGAAIRIYRETDLETTSATFFAGSAIRASDLNDNFTQTLYAAQESNFEADTATSIANAATATANAATATANTALSNSTAAVATANAAEATANTAESNSVTAVNTANSASASAASAVATANTASTNATTAVNTANSAVSTANGAVSTANTALAQANSAVATANTAESNSTAAVTTANTAQSNSTAAVATANSAAADATTAVSTANTALTNSATAISTANAATAAVAAAVIYQPVVDLTALAAITPSDGEFFELQDSTGAESDPSITGITAGLSGDTGLTFRLRYDDPPGEYVFLGYFADDSETRYLKVEGGTLTGQLLGDNSTSPTTPGFAFDGDADTGVGTSGANELALITGGTARVTIDPAGAVTVNNGLSVNNTAITSVLDPTGAQDAATKNYVDTNKLDLTGGTMSGAIDMDSNLINNVTDPSSAQDAATKNYVDTELAAFSQNSIAQNDTNVTITDDGISPGEARIAVDGATAIFFATNGTNAYTPTFHQNRLGLANQNELLFLEDVTNGSNHVGFKAPASISSDVIWTLPATDGTTGQNLTTDGSGALSWTSPSSPALIIDGDSKVQVNDNTPSASYISTQVDGVEVTYTTFDGIELLDQKDLKFYEDNANGTNYLAFKAPASVAANVIWTLPDADAGTAGYALVSDGAGTLSWSSAGGGATGAGGDDVFYENGQTVTTSYTLTAGKNAMSAGPITINSGATVTVGSGQSWVIV